MREVVYRPRAAFDVESIVTYISVVLHSPQAAENWYAQLLEALDLLCGQPMLGREFNDTYLKHQNRRSFLVGNYRLFYSFSANTLTVWRVLHTTQDMDDFALVEWEEG